MSTPQIRAAAATAKFLARAAGGVGALKPDQALCCCAALYFDFGDPRISGAIFQDAELQALVEKTAELHELTDPRGLHYNGANVAALVELADCGAIGVPPVCEWRETDWLEFLKEFKPDNRGKPLQFPEFARLCIVAAKYDVGCRAVERQKKLVEDECRRGWHWRHRPEDQLMQVYREFFSIAEEIDMLPFDLSLEHRGKVLTKFAELDTCRMIIEAIG